MHLAQQDTGEGKQQEEKGEDRAEGGPEHAGLECWAQRC